MTDGFTGSGTVVFEATDTLFGDEVLDNPTYPLWLPSNNWVTVASNRQLSSLTNVTAYFDGGGMNDAHKNKLEPIQFYEISASGDYATGQFQHKSGWSATPNQTQCVMVEFRQNGDDVQMRGMGIGMVGNTSAYGTTKLSIRTDINYTVSSSVSHYGVHDIELMFSSAKPVKLAGMSRYPGIRNMAGSSAGPGGKAQVIVKGTDSTVMRYAPAAGNGHVLPLTDGLLRVQAGGEVIQQKTGMSSTSAMWVDDRAQIYIEKSGVYRQRSDWGVGVKQAVDIMDGEYSVRDIASVAQGHCALNLLTLSGGVRLHSADSDDYVCVGSTNGVINARWTVRGTSASTCDMALRLWAASSGGNMTFAVSDVAEGTDFAMNGTIVVDSSYPNVTVYKTGPGTMQLNASYNVSGKPTLLKDGTWLVNGSSLTSASDPYTIDGGALAVAAGTSNSLGVLTVGEDGGGITLGDGATLTFADSSAAEWTAGESVVITGFTERSVRIGTSGSALTSAQMMRFRTSEGRRLILDPNGYLCYPGSVIILR